MNPKPCQAKNGISNFFFYSLSFASKFFFPFLRSFLLYFGSTFRAPIDLLLQKLGGGINKFICSLLRHLVKYSRQLKNKNMTRQIRYYFKWIRLLEYNKKRKKREYIRLILDAHFRNWFCQFGCPRLLMHSASWFGRLKQTHTQFQVYPSIIENGSNISGEASSHVLSLCMKSNIKTVIIK